MERGRFKEIMFDELNLDSLDDTIQSLNIQSIGLDTTIVINNKEGYFVDENHPMVLAKLPFFADNELVIDGAYFRKHEEKITSILIKYLKNTKQDRFNINDNELVNEEVLKVVASNPNIKCIHLGCSSSPYLLSQKDLDIFEGSGIEDIITDGVSPELAENFSSVIHYNATKKLIGGRSYEELQKLKKFSINNPLTDEEIKNLKYLRKGCEVRVGYFEDSGTIKIIKELLRLDPEANITVDLIGANKNKFTQEILTSNIDGLYDANIIVDTLNLDTINLKKYIDYESRLYKMIEPAIGLSPLEKYLFAYNVVKKFKPYKENMENLQDSRDLYRILEGDYMVCVGYAHLLQDLLDKLGIPARDYSATVAITFDKVPNEERVAEEDKIVGAGHAREEIYINDPKYGIDGIYICDPTWDNDLEHDFYNFALITHENYNKMYRENFLRFYNVSEVLFSSSIEEFYSKANLWMNKYISREMKQSPEEKVLETIKYDLRDLDQGMYDELCKLNPRFKEKNYIPTGKSKTDFLNFVSSYIIHNNQIHPGTLSQHLGYSSYKNLFKASTKEEFYKEYYNKVSFYKKCNHPVEEIFVNRLLEYLHSLFPEYIDEIYKKYNIKKDVEFSLDGDQEPPDYNEVITEIGEFIVEKVNRKVEGSTLRGAITEIYRKCYGISEDELESKISEVFEENAQRHEKTYPTRMAIKPDNTTYPYKETENVFEGKGR